MPAIHRPRATAAVLADAFGSGPFRLGAALDHGLTRDQVDAAVSAGHLVRLRHGVLAPAAAIAACATPEQRHRLDAVALARGLQLVIEDGSAISHTSAGVLRGLPYPGLSAPASWPVEVTGPQPSGPQSTGWRRYRAGLPAGHVTEIDGVPVTTLSRTAVDIAASHPLAGALVVVDAVLRTLVTVAAEQGGEEWRGERRLCGDQRLAAVAREVLLRTWAETGRSRGGRQVARAVAAADPGAENAFESVSRAHVLLAGLPAPRAGFPVTGADGRTYWADLAWPELGVLGEADGRGKYTEPGVLYAEKRRQEALERAGWIVVRWTWDELAAAPQVVVARIAAALDRARRLAA